MAVNTTVLAAAALALAAWYAVRHVLVFLDVLPSVFILAMWAFASLDLDRARRAYIEFLQAILYLKQREYQQEREHHAAFREAAPAYENVFQEFANSDEDEVEVEPEGGASSEASE